MSFRASVILLVFCWINVNSAIPFRIVSKDINQDLRRVNRPLRNYDKNYQYFYRPRRDKLNYKIAPDFRRTSDYYQPGSTDDYYSSDSSEAYSPELHPQIPKASANKKFLSDDIPENKKPPSKNSSKRSQNLHFDDHYKDGSENSVKDSDSAKATNSPDSKNESQFLEKNVIEKWIPTKCVGSRRKSSDRYSSSFVFNNTKKGLSEDAFPNPGEAEAVRSSSVFVGEDVTLCWIETITIKEDKLIHPPRKVVLREFTISFENSATIPEKYLECGKLEGELEPGCHNYQGKTGLFDVVDEDSKVSKLVNFTTISTKGNLEIRQHKNVRCAVGPVVTKNVIDFRDGSKNSKKRVEIKVSPRMRKINEDGESCSSDKEERKKEPEGVGKKEKEETLKSTTPNSGFPGRKSSGTNQKDDRFKDGSSREDETRNGEFAEISLDKEISGKTITPEKVEETTEILNGRKNHIDDNLGPDSTTRMISTDGNGDGSTSETKDEPKSKPETEGSTTENIFKKRNRTTNQNFVTNEEVSTQKTLECTNDCSSCSEDDCSTEADESKTESTRPSFKDETTKTDDPSQSRKGTRKSSNAADLGNETPVVETDQSSKPSLKPLKDKTNDILLQVSPKASRHFASKNLIYKPKKGLTEIPEGSTKSEISTEPGSTQSVKDDYKSPVSRSDPLKEKPKSGETPEETEFASTTSAYSEGTSEGTSDSRDLERKSSLGPNFTGYKNGRKNEPDDSEDVLSHSEEEPTFSTESTEKIPQTNKIYNKGRKHGAEIAQTTAMPSMKTEEVPEKCDSSSPQDCSKTKDGKEKSATWNPDGSKITRNTSSTGKKRLGLRIKILLEQINEDEERKNLVEVDKHLLLDEDANEHNNKTILNQIKALNDSVTAQTIKALLNCSTLEKLSKKGYSVEVDEASYQKGKVGSKTSEPNELILTIEDKKSDEGLAKLRGKRETNNLKDLESVNSTNIGKNQTQLIRDCLPDIQKDINTGVDHVISKLNNCSNSSCFTEKKNLEPLAISDILGIISNPKDSRINEKTKRDVGYYGEGKDDIENLDSWSNERIRRNADGRHIRSLAEFTIFRK